MSYSLNLEVPNQMNRCKSHNNINDINKPNKADIKSPTSNDGGFSKMKSKLKNFFSPHQKSPSCNTNNNHHHKKHSESSSTDNSLSSLLTENQNSDTTNYGANPRTGSLGQATGSNIIHNLSAVFNHSVSVQENCSNSNNNLNDLSNSGIGATTIPSKLPTKFYNDKETSIDVNKKLELFSAQERTELQQRGYDLLAQQVEFKRAEQVSLKAEIDSLNSYLLQKHEQFRSTFEIEALKNEIRSLTNEKAELELMITKNSAWNCKKCTYLNKNEAISCVICNYEKDVNEIIICVHCGTKSSLFSQSCPKCNAYLLASEDTNNNNNDNTSTRDRRSSSNSSSSSSMTSTLSNLHSPTDAGQRNSPAPSYHRTPPLPPSRKIQPQTSSSSNNSVFTSSPVSPPVNPYPVNYYKNNLPTIANLPMQLNHIPVGLAVAASSNQSSPRLALNLMPNNNSLPVRSPLMSPRSPSPLPSSMLQPFSYTNETNQFDKRLNVNKS